MNGSIGPQFSDHDLRRPMRITCDRHHRWTYIQNADGTTASRRCPECPRRAAPAEGGQ